MTDRLSLPLDHILANPYQMRLGDAERAEHVTSLATDIARNGLLQVPLGRPHPQKPGHVQLAFGHSRLAAYKLLADGHVESGDKAQWQAFPVDVRQLSDRQLSDLAAAENSRRKNLSAIETAHALARRIQDFGLTQAEAGEPFGLSQSAVANLLRLLKLPEGVQQHVAAGDLPERLARELLLVARLNPKTAQQIADEAVKVDARDRGEFVTSQIGDALHSKGRNLSNVPWKLDWPAEPILVDNPNTARGEPTQIPACTTCPYYFQHAHQRFCANSACFELKHKLALADTLRKASKRLGVAAAADGDAKAVTVIFDGSSKSLNALQDGYLNGRYVRSGERVKKLLAANLAELRLAPAPDGSHGWELKDILGSECIALGATDVAAVARWLSANIAKPAGEVKAQAIKSETPAQTAKRQAQEEKEKGKRRADRAQFLREKHDVLWLMSHVARQIAERLTLAGGALRFVEDLVHNRFTVAGWPEHNQAEDALREVIRDTVSDRGAGAAREAARRTHIVLDVLAVQVLGYNRPEQAYAWPRAQHECERAAKQFGVELPKGWNQPPVHRTPSNCWTCGRFGSQPGRLTQGETAAGWKLATQGKQVLDVACPECVRANGTVFDRPDSKTQKVKKAKTR